jgi:hypothetical protein
MALVRRRSERGQASVELIAIVPALLVLAILAAQLAVAGWALWSAAGSARAGARVAAVGGDAPAAARLALPPALRGGSRIDTTDGVEVSVDTPALVPGIPSVRVSAGSSLPGGGNG